MVLFTDDMIFYVESTKKLLELISEPRKIARFKTNIQKSTVFSYNNKQMEMKFFKIIIAHKNEILRKNLTQCSQDLHAENCKTLMKEIKEALNKWKVILLSWVQKLNIVKMSIFKIDL